MNWVFYRQQISNYFHSQRKQSGGWLFWFIVLPIVPLLAYMSLGLLKILPTSGDIPRHIYIILGITSWLLFVDGLLMPHKSIDAYKAYFLRREIRLFDLVVAWVPERSLTAALQFLFCLAVVSFVAPFEISNFLAYLLITLLGFLLFLGIGVLVGVIGLVSPSLINLIEVVNRFLLFLSAVIFPLPSNEWLDIFKVVNPYYVFIDSSRLVLFGLPLDWQPILWWSGIAFVIFLFLKLRLELISADVRDYLF